MNSTCSIFGLDYFLPSRVLSNSDLEQMVETSDEWIVSRTGIKTRRIVSPDQACSDLALEAGQGALEKAKMSPQDIDLIIVATCTPDSSIPSTACVLQHKLGLKSVPAFDMTAACSGFIYGLETARAHALCAPEKNILLVASEVVTSRIDFTDRGTCVLFGDGAGAAVIGGRPSKNGLKLIDVMTEADGGLGHLLTIKGGGSAHPPQKGGVIGPEYFVQMHGRDVFKHAVRSMASISQRILKRNGLQQSDIDHVIPHQANIRIIQALAKRLETSPEKIFVNVDRYGNCSAASVPIALAECMQMREISDGDRFLLTSFGGGFTWAAAILEYVAD